MEIISREHRALIQEWINAQYLTGRPFPERFGANETGSSIGSLPALKALKDWRNLPSKRSYLSAWARENLTDKECKELESYVIAQLDSIHLRTA